MGELKPCAWCRSKRKPWYKYGTNSCKWGAAVCSDCGAQAPEVRTGYDESENAPWHEDADREWNTRAASEPCSECVNWNAELGHHELACYGCKRYHADLFKAKTGQQPKEQPNE